MLFLLLISSRIMEWIIYIVILGVVIGIARKYPKTCIILSILLLIAYCREQKLNRSKIHIPSSETEFNHSKNNLDNNNSFRNDTPTSTEIELSTPKPIYIPHSNNAETTKKRVGAVCRDGSTSKAIGRGACSHHGGVAYWLYE